MLKPFLIIPVLVFFSAPAFFQQAPSTPPSAGQTGYVVPPEYIGKANPVKPTPEMQARVKKLYGWDCAMCHGDNGDGKGEMAGEQKLPMSDFRVSLAKMSDGEIFYIIQNGKSKMPSEGDRAKPDELWNMVAYLRTMSNTSQPGAATQPAQ